MAKNKKNFCKTATENEEKLKIMSIADPTFSFSLVNFERKKHAMHAPMKGQTGKSCAIASVPFQPEFSSNAYKRG